MSETKGNLHGREFGKTSKEYLVGELAGHGGYGEVYRATEIEIERTVALKVLRRSASGHYPDRLKQRFLREAKIIGRLQDANTVRLLEYGTDAETELLFMAFEFIDGTNLGELIRRDGSMEPGRVVDILKRALSALEEAHSLGVLHRDVKPGNIMVYDYLGRMDQVKVLDFGIGKLMREVTSELTVDGRIIGTPQYMSPEQLRGEEKIGPASDIFALGLVAYEMLVGRNLLPAEPMVVSYKLLSEEPFKLPEGVCIDAPGVRAVVEKMLAKDETRRYSDARSIIRDLMHLRPLETHEVESLEGGSLAKLGKGPKEEPTVSAAPGAEDASSAEESSAVPVPTSATPSTAPDRGIAPFLLAGAVLLGGVTLALWPTEQAQIAPPPATLSLIEEPDAPTLAEENNSLKASPTEDVVAAAAVARGAAARAKSVASRAKEGEPASAQGVEENVDPPVPAFEEKAQRTQNPKKSVRTRRARARTTRMEAKAAPDEVVAPAGDIAEKPKKAGPILWGME